MLALFALPLLAYATLCCLMYFKQRELIYFPQFTRGATPTDFTLARDGVTLRGWVVSLMGWVTPAGVSTKGRGAYDVLNRS